MFLEDIIFGHMPQLNQSFKKLNDRIKAAMTSLKPFKGFRGAEKTQLTVTTCRTESHNLLAPHPGKCEVISLSKALLIGPLHAIYIGNSIIEYKATARSKPVLDTTSERMHLKFLHM